MQNTESEIALASKTLLNTGHESVFSRQRYMVRMDGTSYIHADKRTIIELNSGNGESVSKKRDESKYTG